MLNYNNIKNYLLKFVDYTYETKMNINLNDKDLLNYLIYIITGNISVNHINDIKIFQNRIILSANENIYKNLQSILPLKYVSIKLSNKEHALYYQYEYIIEITNSSALKQLINKNSIYNLEHKYFGNAKYDNNHIYFYSDEPIINQINANTLNIRIIDQDGPEEFKYNVGNIEQKELLELLNQNKMRASFPVLQYTTENKTIDNMTINENNLIIQLNEQAFFQAVEMFKKHKYKTLVIELNNKIYGKCSINDLAKQRIYITCKDELEAQQLHKNLLYHNYEIDIIYSKSIVSENIYKLMLLIALLLMLLFFAIRKREYSKYIIIASICLFITFNFKLNYILLINLFAIFILDYMINNFYMHLTYLISCSLFLIYFKISYDYSAILLHNTMYSLILTLYGTKNINK